MQRVKFADRRSDTRDKIILGGLVIKAGSKDLSEREIVGVLKHYIEHGAEPKLDEYLKNMPLEGDDK